MGGSAIVPRVSVLRAAPPQTGWGWGFGNTRAVLARGRLWGSLVRSSVHTRETKRTDEARFHLGACWGGGLGCSERGLSGLGFSQLGKQSWIRDQLVVTGDDLDAGNSVYER